MKKEEKRPGLFVETIVLTHFLSRTLPDALSSVSVNLEVVIFNELLIHIVAISAPK